MVKVSGLSSGYSGKDVLSGIDLTLSPGELTILVGPNGCGKSTLLKTLCGLLPAKSGEILLNGEHIAAYSSRQLAQQVSYLAQSRPVSDISVEHMVLHGRFPYLSYPRRYRQQDLEIARRAMDQLGISEFAAMPLSTLSGGTRQKVYIAMALAQDTPIVLLDEPTTYLDIAHQLQMMEHARFLCRQGKTVVMVLHDISMALQTADRLIVMNDGRILQQGKPEDVFASGCLDAVFGVHIGRVPITNGWHYYYDTQGGMR